MFSLNLQSGVPIYEQLVKRVTELILSGSLTTDDKMPTIRSVAKELGVNPNTVQKAYQMLEQAGLIYSIPGKGSYINTLDDKIIAIKNAVLEEFTQHVLNAIKQGLTKDELIDAVKGA